MYACKYAILSMYLCVNNNNALNINIFYENYAKVAPAFKIFNVSYILMPLQSNPTLGEILTIKKHTCI